MGGTRSSHLPLDRKSVLNIISFRSSMPARRDVGNAGWGEAAVAEIALCAWEYLSFSLALYLKIFHTLSSFNGIHNNGTFCILAFFTWIFCCFFLHFWPIAIGRRRRRTATAKATATRRRWTTALSTVIRVCSLQSALNEWRQPTSARAWQVRRRRRLESNWQTAVAVAVAVAALHSQLLVVGEGGRTPTRTH